MSGKKWPNCGQDLCEKIAHTKSSCPRCGKFYETGCCAGIKQQEILQGGTRVCLVCGKRIARGKVKVAKILRIDDPTLIFVSGTLHHLNVVKICHFRYLRLFHHCLDEKLPGLDEKFKIIIFPMIGTRIGLYTVLLIPILYQLRLQY